jgi:hypothetical protein
VNAAARVWARYAAAYHVVLGLALLALLALLAIRARQILVGTLVQAAFAEVLLAVVAIADHRWEQIPADIGLCPSRCPEAAPAAGITSSPRNSHSTPRAAHPGPA